MKARSKGFDVMSLMLNSNRLFVDETGCVVASMVSYFLGSRGRGWKGVDGEALEVA